MSWREYHEATKHTPERLRASRHTLDWANQPDPFRHYEGAPLIDLPADPEPPPIPTLNLLAGRTGETNAAGAGFFSQLFFYSAAISAAKRSPSGTKYALRVNPSSGNLHPTEFHFASRGLPGWEDGLYHYRPSSHMVEQRARGEALPELFDGHDTPLVFMLTSIAWREAWKYQDRAYRYCCHDIGHAWQALVLAAQAMGCRAAAVGEFPDDRLHLNSRLAEDEWPMLLVRLWPAHPAPVEAPTWASGTPNSLSAQPADYASISRIHQLSRRAPAPPDPPGLGGEPFGLIARRRRSALDFEGGPRLLTQHQLTTLLQLATRPLASDFAGAYVDLYLFVHRVDDVPPGIYRYHDEALQSVHPGDHRVLAAALSLRQQLAGNSCVTLAMAADLDTITRKFGDRGYRYAHFLAGAIGQRLYLAAEALGFQSTGIGAFFDDEVNRYLGLPPTHQVIYHFACGYAVPDDRLSA